MTNQAAPSGRSSVSPERYRQAEDQFWKLYGLTPQEHFVQAGSVGARLRVQESGEGEPVLFVHGTGGSGAYFAPLIRHLDGYRCLVLDRPGWGLSDPIDFAGRDYNSLIVELLSEILDQLGVERAHVVGGSVGDAWVLRLAQAEPSRVDRMVWLGSTLMAGFGVPVPIKLLASPLGRVLVRLGEKEKVMRKQLASIGHRATVESGTMDAYLHWRAIQAQEIHFLRHERNMVQAMQQRRRWLPGLAVEDSDLSELAHPILLVYGSNDPLGTVDIWRQKIDLVPSGNMEVIEGAGHLPWFDAPEHIGRIMDHFLKA